MSRVLSIAERHVSEREREAYLLTLRTRSSSAKNLQANFWVFEHATEQGRFVEFTEAANEMVVAAANPNGASAQLWHEVEMT